jgi:hypothetical protein
MLLIMHHIALCTQCIALFNYDNLLHIRVDHVEPKSEFQAKQVRWVVGGPQVSSSEDANIVMIKASLSASHQSSLSFLSIFKLMSCWIVHLHL